MTNKKSIAIALAFALPVLALMIWLNRTKRPSGEAAPAPSGAASQTSPQDAVHELASLGEQLRQRPNHAPILLRMAELQKKAGKTQEALKLLRQAAAAEPVDAGIQLEVGKALFEANDPEAAIAATKRILGPDPKNVDALYNLGAIYGNMNDDASATSYFRRAAEAGPATESGKKAQAALVQLALPPPTRGPGTGALPPGHPPLPQK